MRLIHTVRQWALRHAMAPWRRAALMSNRAFTTRIIQLHSSRTRLGITASLFTPARSTTLRLSLGHRVAFNTSAVCKKHSAGINVARVQHTKATNQSAACICTH